MSIFVYDILIVLLSMSTYVYEFLIVLLSMSIYVYEFLIVLFSMSIYVYVYEFLIVSVEYVYASVFTVHFIQRANGLSAIATVDAARCTIALFNKIKLPDVTLDKNLNFDGQVKNVRKTSLFHIRALRHLRLSLTEETAKRRCLCSCSVTS